MESKIGRKISISGLLLSLIMFFLSPVYADPDRVRWEELAEHLSEKSIPLIQLNLCDFPDNMQNLEPDRVVSQIIENTYYLWEEYDITTDTDEYMCILMKKPNPGTLSAQEAQVLLTGSMLWRASIANPENRLKHDLNESYLEQEDGELSRPEAVIETDDRTRITDTRTFPWNTHCYLEFEFTADPYTYIGTGCLVTPYMVLTCAHNIYDHDSESYLEKMTVIPGLRQDYKNGPLTEPYESKDIVEFRIAPDYVNEDSVVYEYGAVFLDEPFADINTYMPVEFSSSLSIGDTVYIAGYPGVVKVGTNEEDTNASALWDASGPITDINPEVIRYTTDTSEGDSGAPIRNKNSSIDPYRIIGIHSRSNSAGTINSGARLGAHNQALISEWMEQTPSQTITIGTEFNTCNYPIHTNWHDSRTQVIYLANEIGRGGPITSLAIDITKIPAQTLNNWTIRIKHTSQNAYHTCSLDGDGWTIVYQNNEEISDTGWRQFEFQTPFQYNGNDNLLVDFSHNNTSFTGDGKCTASRPGGQRTACAYSDSEDGDPLSWSGINAPHLSCSDYVPNIRLDIFGADITEIAKLTASDGAPYDIFGSAVDIEGDYLFVGAHVDDDHKGSVYIFKYNGSQWIQDIKIIAPDRDAYEWQCFGGEVEAQGNRVLIGAYYNDDNGYASGAVYVYERNGSLWSQKTKLMASDGCWWDLFGASLALDGDYAVIGAPGDDSDIGSVYVFKKDGDLWSEQIKLTAPTVGYGRERYGESVSIDDNYIIVGVPSADDVGDQTGAAYIYKRNGSTWNLQTKLLPSDSQSEALFGFSVSICNEYAVVGACGKDYTENYPGTVHIFELIGDDWIETTQLVAPDIEAGDQYGADVSISNDFVVVGARHNNGMKGCAHLFMRSGDSWIHASKLTASDGNSGDNFGNRVRINGSNIVIGSLWDDDKGTNSGSVYVFKIE